MSVLECLLDEFLMHVGYPDTPAVIADGGRTLVFDDWDVVCRDEGDRALLMATIKSIPDDGQKHHDALLKLLQRSLACAGSERSNLALDKTSRELVLYYRFPIADLSVSAFKAEFEYFLNQLRFWAVQTRVAFGDNESRPAPSVISR